MFDLVEMKVYIEYNLYIYEKNLFVQYESKATCLLVSCCSINVHEHVYVLNSRYIEDYQVCIAFHEKVQVVMHTERDLYIPLRIVLNLRYYQL